MSAQCCEKCDATMIGALGVVACGNSKCPCHQTHTTKEAPQEAFANVVWEALHADHNDLRKQQIILRACRAEITKAQVSVLEEVASIVEAWHYKKGGYTELAHQIRDRITNKQSEI